MSFDVSPFGAFAIETCVQPGAAHAQGHTITVRVGFARTAQDEALHGTIALRAAAPAPATLRHAGVLADDAKPLTITL